MRLLTSCCVGLLISTSGCGWLGSERADEQRQTTVFVEQPLRQARFVDRGRVVNVSRLKEGGRLLVRPFSPGPYVAMTEELDMISLRIIRGILDVYEGLWPKDDNVALSKERFDVAVLEDQEAADLILSGRITEVGFTPAWKKWMFVTPRISLAVEGRVIETKNNTTVLMFSDRIEKDLESHTHRSLGLTLGRRIGQFVFLKRE